MEEDDKENLAVGPTHQFLANIAKIQKGIKRAATHDIPRTPITPDLKQSPKTPARGEKPKFFFKTGSKGKRLLSKTPRKTSSFQKSSSSAFKTPEKSSEELATELPFSGTVDESPRKSPSELARESIRKIRRKAHLSQVQEKKKVLKKLR